MVIARTRARKKKRITVEAKFMETTLKNKLKIEQIRVDKPVIPSSDHKSPLPIVSSLDPHSSDDEEKFGMPRIELKKTPTVDISVPSHDNSTDRARTSDLTAKNKNTFIEVNLRSVSPNLDV